MSARHLSAGHVTGRQATWLRDTQMQASYWLAINSGTPLARNRIGTRVHFNYIQLQLVLLQEEGVKHDNQEVPI